MTKRRFRQGLRRCHGTSWLSGICSSPWWTIPALLPPTAPHRRSTSVRASRSGRRGAWLSAGRTDDRLGSRPEGIDRVDLLAGSGGCGRDFAGPDMGRGGGTFLERCPHSDPEGRRRGQLSADPRRRGAEFRRPVHAGVACRHKDRPTVRGVGETNCDQDRQVASAPASTSAAERPFA